jgi:hypothetical protein
MVISSLFNLGLTKDLRFAIVLPERSAKASPKNLSGSCPGIESVKPSVKRRRAPPGGTMAVPAPY